jgi:hypothetical protein
VMRSDGANPRRVLQLDFANGFPDWQPLAN